MSFVILIYSSLGQKEGRGKVGFLPNKWYIAKILSEGVLRTYKCGQK